MLLGILLALGQTISWAGASIVLRRLSAEHDATVLNGLRSLAALCVILPLVWITGQQGGWAALDWRSLLYIVGATLAGGVVGDSLYIAVLDMIGVARTLPITNSFPMFTLLLSALLLDEPITWLMVAGIVLVLLGGYLVTQPSRGKHATMGPPPAKRLGLGVALAVLVALLWAGAAVALSIGLRQVPALIVVNVRLSVVACLSLVLATIRGKIGQVARFRGPELRRLLLSSLLGSVGAATLYILALEQIGPSRVTTVNATLPLFGAAFSYLFLRERLSPLMWAGTVLTVAGLVLVVL